MTIRNYNAADENALVTLIKLNTPKYFASSEEQDFVEYLDNSVEMYFVVEVNRQIVGCGGINYFNDEGIARLSWDIVHPDFHGKGIGTALVQTRIDEIKRRPHIRSIVVRTSNMAYRFYEKFGFEIESTTKDYWSEGLDLYVMRMDL